MLGNGRLLGNKSVSGLHTGILGYLGGASSRGNRSGSSLIGGEINSAPGKNSNIILGSSANRNA